MSELEEDFWSSGDHEHVSFFGSVLGGGAYLLLITLTWLWRLYVEYLWNWNKHPWILSLAASFKLTAILIIAPFGLLALLDVGAYVIARTLGVVETTKASTSDSKILRGVYGDSDSSETDTTRVATPPVRIDVVHAPGTSEAEQNVLALAPDVDMSPSPSPSSGSVSTTTSGVKSRLNLDNLAIPVPHVPYSLLGKQEESANGPEPEACFFSPSDESLLELSGGLLSSPTPSRQSSPGLERRHRAQSPTAQGLQAHNASPSAASDAGSTESFIVLEPSGLNRDVPETQESDSALDTRGSLRRRGAGCRDNGIPVS